MDVKRLLMPLSVAAVVCVGCSSAVGSAADREATVARRSAGVADASSSDVSAAGDLSSRAPSIDAVNSATINPAAVVDTLVTLVGVSTSAPLVNSSPPEGLLEAKTDIVGTAVADALPRTGSRTTTLLIVASLMTAIGLAMTCVQRRRPLVLSRGSRSRV